MKIKAILFSLIASLSFIFPIYAKANMDDNFASDFKHATYSRCDKVFKQHENDADCALGGMICRDVLVDAWAECWKRTMNTELDKRLLSLKKSNSPAFHTEMNLQKTFNQAVTNLCKKDCGASNMHGISYNFCRVDTYKYRTAQAIQINKHALSVSSEGALLPELSFKDKEKDTHFFQPFAAELCQLPNTVWKNGSPEPHCKSEILADLNKFAFTDDVCDLS